MLVFNLATGRFVLGFDTPGIIAHSEHLWNILGMYTCLLYTSDAADEL